MTNTILGDVNLDFLLAESIKDHLVNLAANDELPLDMTQLDMSGILEDVAMNFDTNPQVKRLRIHVEMGKYLSFDQDDFTSEYLDEVLVKLKASEPDLLIDNIEGFHPVECFEASLTASELLDKIGA